MKSFRSSAVWMAAVFAVTLGTLVLVFAPAALADGGPANPTLASLAAQIRNSFSDQQIFNQNLTVTAGETLSDNVSVYSGDVRVEEGGRVSGNLSIFGGDLRLDGEVGGNLAIFGGDARLTATARVEGNVSVIGGEVTREPGAYVGGNFIGGSGSPANPRADEREGDEHQDEHSEFAPDPRRDWEQPRSHDSSWFLNFLRRLAQAVLWTLLITGLVLLIVWLLPKQVEEITRTAETETGLSFATGALVALGAGLVSAILMITICLSLLAFPLLALLALVVLFGWAVTSNWLGRRLDAFIQSQTNLSWHPLLSVAISALFITGVTSFAWAIVACLGFLIALLIGSTGTGAVLVHLARTSGRGPAVLTAGPDAPQPGSPQPPTDGDPTPPQSGPRLYTGPELGLTQEEEEQLQRGADILQPDDPPPPAERDDFTRIQGIGPTFASRLHDAGILTFAQLAGLEVEEIAEIIGWSPARVERDELREQAAALAEQ